MEQPRIPVVWLINEGGHDYSTAAKYGRIMTMTEGSVNPFNIDRLMLLVSKPIGMGDAEDYLAISGSPILNALVLAMWLRRFGKANLLLWYHGNKSNDSGYRLVALDGNNLDRLALSGQKKEPVA